MTSNIVIQERPGRTALYYDGTFYLPHILNYDYECSSSPAVVARIVPKSEIDYIYKFDFNGNRDEEIAKILDKKESTIAWVNRENGSTHYTWCFKNSRYNLNEVRVYWHYADAYDVELSY